MTERDKYIINSYTSGIAAKEIALNIGCCDGTVFNVLKRNGVSTRARRLDLSEKQELDIIEEYMSGNSMLSISNNTGIYYDAIRKILKKHGINQMSYSKLKNINLTEDYFKHIDTSNKAYWIGWIISDGSIYGNKLEMALQRRDRYILEMLESDLGVKNKIHDFSIQGKDYSRFSIGCKNMIEDLKNLGITENKTFSVKVPKLDNRELDRHLIRGLFDGDGSISINKRKTGVNAGKYSYELSFTGNIYIVQYVKDVLENSIHILSKKNIEDNHSVKRIRWSSTRDIKLIMDYMYEQSDDHFLKRKYDKIYLLS